MITRTEFYPNNKLKHREIMISDCKITEYFYESGRQTCKWRYLNGNSHGLQEGWYDIDFDTGDTHYLYKENYSNGKLHGLRERWYSTGKQEFKESYVNGKLHGMQFDFYIDKKTYFRYGNEITKEEYEQYINSIKKGILNILQIGKNTLDLIITKYLIC